MVRMIFLAAGLPLGFVFGFIVAADLTTQELTKEHAAAMEDRLEIEQMNIEMVTQSITEEASQEANDAMLQRLFRTCAAGSGKFVIKDATTGLDFYFTCKEVLMNQS